VSGSTAFVFIYRAVTETRDPVSRSFDVPGQLLFIVGIGALTYALIQGGHDGWGSALILGCFALAVVVLVTFVLYEQRAREPMGEMGVFRYRVYDAAISRSSPRSSASTGRCSSSRSTSRTCAYSPEEDRLPDVGDDDPDDRPLTLSGRIVAARRAFRRSLASRRLSSAPGSWPRAARAGCGWHSSGSRSSALPAGSRFRPPRVRRWGRSRRSDRAWRRAF
jgi:hypothetical protein